MADAEGVVVPLESLSAEALRGLVEAFINREGTDYGAVERTLEEKVTDVMRELEAGRARILYDPESESVSIAPVE